MAKLLLGIDIGTSACKAAVFTVEGEVIAQASKAYGIYYPASGWVEQDPQEWWVKVCEAVQAVLNADGVSAAQIAAVGVDGQSWSAIPIDKNGRVLYNTPNWMDNRSNAITERVKAEVGAERIFAVSGNRFEPTYTTPKILWFKEERPDIFQRTAAFLQSNSYIVYKMTGKITQDLSQGYGLHVFNISRGEYDSDLCKDLGIPLEMLPPLYPCHQIVGTVTAQAAQETGLRADTPVVAGGLDAACGTLGAGVTLPGETQEQGGQAGGMSICVDHARAHPQLILSNHVVPGMYLRRAVLSEAAALYGLKSSWEHMRKKWRKHPAGVLLRCSAKWRTNRSGSDGLVFLPYMAGERSPIWDVNAKGVFYGLSYAKTKGHLIRSIMEGCAYALLHNLETAEEAGVSVSVLNSMGGAANSEVWTQIKADVTGKPIQVPASDTATALGAAILAGVGIGVYSDFQQAVEQTIQIKRIHYPNQDNYHTYQIGYRLYRELYERLKDLMAKY